MNKDLVMLITIIPAVIIIVAVPGYILVKILRYAQARRTGKQLYFGCIGGGCALLVGPFCTWTGWSLVQTRGANVYFTDVPLPVLSSPWGWIGAGILISLLGILGLYSFFTNK